MYFRCYEVTKYERPSNWLLYHCWHPSHCQGFSSVNVQTWLLIGWQHSCHPIRSQVCTFMSNNLDFSLCYRPLGCVRWFYGCLFMATNTSNSNNVISIMTLHFSVRCDVCGHQVVLSISSTHKVCSILCSTTSWIMEDHAKQYTPWNMHTVLFFLVFNGYIMDVDSCIILILFRVTSLSLGQSSTVLVK